MSNEELAERIRDGEAELIPELWENVKGFVRHQAYKYNRRYPGRGGAEPGDLVQSAYFAMLTSVQDFRREKGFPFMAFLMNDLKTEFSRCFGFYSSRDALNRRPLSLDAPIAEDKGERTLADNIQDPTENAIEEVEREIWLEQLRSALDAAMDQLPQDQRQTLKNRYYQGKTLEDTSTASGIPEAEVRKLERRGLDQLRRDKRKNGLEQFIDSQTNFYNYVSVNTFNTTHCSAVEKAVIYRENIRQQGEKQ